MNQTISQEEWNELYDRVYGFFFRRVSDRYICEDLTSKTLSSYVMYDKEVQSQHGLLWGIARNNLKKYYTKKSGDSHIPVVDQDNLKETIDTNYSAEYKMRVQDLLHCIQKNLSQTEFTIVQHIVMNDFSSSDVAKELSLKAPAVRQRLSRALKKVRQTCKKLWA